MVTELGPWPNPFKTSSHRWTACESVGETYAETHLHGKVMREEDFGRTVFYRGDGVFGIMRRTKKGKYSHIRFTESSLPDSMRSLFDA